MLSENRLLDSEELLKALSLLTSQEVDTLHIDFKRRCRIETVSGLTIIGICLPNKDAAFNKAFMRIEPDNTEFGPTVGILRSDIEAIIWDVDEFGV